MEYENNNQNNTLNVDILGMVKDCFNNIADTVDSLHRLNIMVVGNSGVGKSTLINCLFRDNLAKTGAVEAVTQKIEKYSKPHYPLTIYDTRGFELDSKTLIAVKREIMETVNYSIRSNNPDDVIHCILYCINAASRRIEPEEINFIKSLTDDAAALRVPVIVVLTQAYSQKYSQNMIDYIRSLSLNVNAIVPILAENYDLGFDKVVLSYGLDRLVNEINNTLNDDLRKTLANVQRANLEQKKKRAEIVVNMSVAEAVAAVALNPIPVADSVALVAIESKMIAEITTVFGASISRSVITAFVSMSLGTNAATIGGKSLSSALKLIPGMGTAAAAFIDTGVATAITKAMGEAYIQLMTMVIKNEFKASDLNTEEGLNKLFTIIDSHFRDQQQQMGL